MKTLVAATALTLGFNNVDAQVLTLQSLDGTISITGELVEANSENYVIMTNIGEMTIATEQVTCLGDNCPEITPAFTEFTISGARSLGQELLPDLLDGFGRSLELDVIHQTDANGNPSVSFASFDGEDVAKISFQLNGSTRGLSDLVIDQASIAITTRVIRDAEASAISAAGLGDITTSGLENILALDALVIVTATSNRVHIINDAVIADVFSGRITNWAELGGDDAPINLYGRPENSGTGSVFSQLILRPARARLAANLNEQTSDGAVADAVAADPNGIGFTTYSNERSARSMALLGTCGVQSPATNFTIKTEEYPFSRRMYLYRLENNLPVLARKFIEYLDTVEAQKIVSFSGFVGQNVTEESVNNQGLRFLAAMLPSNSEATLPALQNIMAELSTARRSTVTYRFGQGNSQLDSRSQSDIVRLANLVESNDLAAEEIMLIGFTDSVGVSDINASLSVQRAEQVRAALLAELGPDSANASKIRVLGFGELSPLGCNDSLTGRQINRRVEVWTR